MRAGWVLVLTLLVATMIAGTGCETTRGGINVQCCGLRAAGDAVATVLLEERVTEPGRLGPIGDGLLALLEGDAQPLTAEVYYQYVQAHVPAGYTDLANAALSVLPKGLVLNVPLSADNRARVRAFALGLITGCEEYRYAGEAGGERGEGETGESRDEEQPTTGGKDAGDSGTTEAPRAEHRDWAGRAVHGGVFCAAAAEGVPGRDDAGAVRADLGQGDGAEYGAAELGWGCGDGGVGDGRADAGGVEEQVPEVMRGAWGVARGDARQHGVLLELDQNYHTTYRAGLGMDAASEGRFALGDGRYGHGAAERGDA